MLHFLQDLSSYVPGEGPRGLGYFQDRQSSIVHCPTYIKIR